MKVHIITGHFFPQLHPRAFRANELALEFARRGYEVVVTNCWTIEGFDYVRYAQENNLLIQNLNIFSSKLDNRVQTSTHRPFKSGLMKIIKEYFIGDSLFFRGPQIGDKLIIDDDVDLVIVLSTPFSCQYGYSRYSRKIKHDWVSIADSGDPFYGSKQTPRAIWFKWLEKKVYKQFDYLTIPTVNAIPLYTPTVKKEKINVIPQGFRMDNLRLYKGELGEKVRFAYAGVFYWDIRNPEFLFRYLDALSDVDYEFNVYMRTVDTRLKTELEKYPNLKEKIKIQYSLPHDELLYELSKMHFLVNIENLSNTQMPSKLIDYGMTGRPIFSCKKDTFEPAKFEDFMKGNYSRKYDIDVKQYDIRHIVDQFLLLKDKTVKK